MNKFKKIMLAFLVVIGISCLAGAAACSKKPKYYQLTFEGTGIDYVLQDKLAEFESGGTVRSGLEVKFKVLLGSNSTGTPSIYLNGEILTADADGFYSFVIKKDSVVSVSGLTVLRTVVLDKMQDFLDAEGNTYSSETRISYTDENGKELDKEIKVEDGGSFKFKLKVSPYYVRKKTDGTTAYTVSRNTEELIPDSDGVYTVSDVNEDSTISVSGLEQELGFTDRGDGTGTAADPYLIKRPIDLFYLAAYVNSEFYAYSFYGAHFKMVEDIDMEGEQLYVIGNSENDAAVFSGTFDGNNKKIKNFYITDEVINQETFAQEYLTYVGLFGTAVATLENPVVIKNVILEDYKIEVHPAQSQQYSCSGSLLGFGIGVQISGCSLNGEIVAVGDDNQMIYTGGVVGLLQSAYNTQGRVVSYDAYVTNTATDVEINGVGSLRSAGGVVGYLTSADISSIAYVANCSSYGSVSGAMHSGGIVGTMGRYTSIANCYASGEIIANNGIGNPLLMDDYKIAYAGGIAGFSANDTVISNCYAANADLLFAESASGSRYEQTGTFLGAYAPAEDDAIDGMTAVVFKSITAGNADAIKNTLGWLDADWSFDGEPRAKASTAGRKITLKILDGDFNAMTGEKNVEASLATLYSWYSGGEIDEFITSSDKRSWGYYFDRALTQKVPACYIPTASETILYTGFADYSSVAGVYYLRSSAYSGNAYIELTADGRALFRDGGMHYEGTYTYDGKNEKVWLINSCLGALIYAVDELDGAHCTMRGDVSGSGIDFVGLISVVDVANSTEEDVSYKTETFELHGTAKLNSFVYGEYVSAGDVTYLFKGDGTGVIIRSSGRQSFSYTVETDKVVINLGVGTMEAALSQGRIVSINGAAVTLKDVFAGTWQKTANSTVKYTFDGINTLTYQKGAQKETVSYTVAEDSATFTLGGTPRTANIVDGVLVIDGEEYYLGDGFTGTWYLSDDSERIELTLEGVGKEGYGYAVISYAGSVVADLDAQYSVEGGVMLVYVGEDLYGELTLAQSGTRANGLFYSLQYEGYRTGAQFDIYDDFRGSWISSADDFSAVIFNGRSANGSGEAVITTAGGSAKAGSYTLTDGSNGELTVGDKVYTIVFDEISGEVKCELKTGGERAVLARTDGWSSVVLYDGATEYRFDGKGYIGGTVTVTGGQTYPYTVAVDGTVTIDGTVLVPTEGGFTYGAKTLAFKSGYAGEWIMSGAKRKITVSEVNGNFTASVIISAMDGTDAQNKTAVYDPAAGTLTVTERVEGFKTVITLTLLRADELRYELNDGGVGEYAICVKPSVIDSWQGTYSNGTSSWTFDGLGASVYGSGTATLTRGGVSTDYRYKINALGMPYIKYEGGVIFIPFDRSDAFVKEGQTTKYVTVVPDALYELSAVESGGNEDIFIFDGAGTLYKKDGDSYVKAYSYIINADGTLKLTDAAGKVYIGTVTTQGRLNYIKIEEQTA